jgi:hypothetical protein
MLYRIEKVKSGMVYTILTGPAFFPIEHRKSESVCYYAIKSLFDALYLDMWRNNYTCDVTTKNVTRWQ